MSSYPIADVRAQFPSLREGSALFDGPGGTQTPDRVSAAIRDALRSPVAQRGTHNHFSRGADRIVRAAREAMADFVGGVPEGIIFGRSATQLTFDMASAVGGLLHPGDEIVLSARPRRQRRPLARGRGRAGGLEVRWIDFDRDTGDIPVQAAARVIGPRTRLVAIAAASNLLGTVPDIAAIAGLAHDVGALVHVDAVAYAAHRLVDLEALGADLLVCSSYKFCGPHLGILAGRPATLERLHPRKLRPSTEQVPERFELGTLPYELLAGVTATVEFLADLAPSGGTRRERLAFSYEALHGHEAALFGVLVDGLAEIPGVRRIGAPPSRTPTVLFRIDGISSDAAAVRLGEREISVGAGLFYAYEAAGWATALEDGGIRAGLAPYTTVDDVNRLLRGVRRLAEEGSVTR